MNLKIFEKMVSWNIEVFTKGISLVLCTTYITLPFLIDPLLLMQCQ